MDESSSDGSTDEEEVMKNFDEEAKKIVEFDTLPKKSAERYLLIYNNYKKWQEENKNSLSTNSEENNLIVYFNTLKGKLKPPTLWSIWSMLRSTLNSKENLDISKFITLKSIIKNYNKGYKPKKSLTLTWTQIIKFMTTADDHVYLVAKVILVFGICGALRCDEITNMKVEDVEDLGDKFLVSIESNKNEYPGQFIIGNLFYKTVKDYILLRPAGQFNDRFFIQYHTGKCTRQAIGRHKIGEVPSTIASYLKLENSKKYTGHCFRRTAATLLSESGANMQMIKQLGRWRSDIIAEGYIENSLHNRQLIFDGITHAPKPSTSKEAPKEVGADFNLDWSDFEEEFPLNKSVPTPGIKSEFTVMNNKKIVTASANSSEHIAVIPFDKSDQILDAKSGFATANNRKILTPPANTSEHSSTKLFYSKTPIKVNFKNEVTKPPTYKQRNLENVNTVSAQPSTNKKRNLENENPEDQEQDVNEDLNDRNSSLTKYFKFENCNFQSFVVNIHNQCDKKNHS